jgi:KDO2-lipid IV(A) lauroyltransferase
VHDEVHVPDGGDRAAKIHSMTQRVATAFQLAIASHPQDWHMLQRVWSADLDPARQSAAPAES